MGTVADILAGIKSRIVLTLGAEYRELPYSLDVAKNRFAAGTKGYAAWADRIDQAEGVTRHVTVDQDFQVVLTETFGAAQLGDANQRTAGQTLYARMESVFTDLVKEKAGVPSRVLIVQRLVVLPIEFLDSNVAVLRASFSIKYRNAL